MSAPVAGGKPEALDKHAGMGKEVMDAGNICTVMAKGEEETLRISSDCFFRSTLIRAWDGHEFIRALHSLKIGRAFSAA
jgi:hypothetical protein